MGVIVDTSVLIAAERGTFDMAAYLEALGEESVALGAISASELLHGVERARAAVRAARSSFVEGVLANVPVLPFGLAEARVHARLWAVFAAEGRMIGPHDLQIAATAVATGSTVATLNAAEFRRVPGLNLAAVERFTTA